MPIINHYTSIVVTPQKFVDACSDIELQELELIMQSRKVQQRLKMECTCISDLAKNRCPHYRAYECCKKEDLISK